LWSATAKHVPPSATLNDVLNLIPFRLAVAPLETFRDMVPGLDMAGLSHENAVEKGLATASFRGRQGMSIVKHVASVAEGNVQAVCS
jgi:hypothetical protein